jgi:glycosyltransferase involved in cell wall biosynthesis
MAQRRKIGLVFSSNDNWIGGTYYILNLIHSLNTLEPNKKPTIIIFSDKESDWEVVQKTDYPYLEFKNLTFKYSILERLLNKLSRTLFGKNFQTKQHPESICDAIFPFNGEEALDKIPQKICWIPDFQEHYLPNLFTEEQIQNRRNHQKKLLSLGLELVLSSQDSYKSYQEIYPELNNKVYVVNFAVTHPEYIHLNINTLKEKFNVTKPYFISPNQFWSHKNHIVILKALDILTKQNKEIDFQVVFTGKEYDPKSPNYTENLKNFVQENNLSDKVRFLGFIDRDEQLQLMNNALAVIQPSLFEGWSTVVEDAKAMNQRTILSDLQVHKEQKDANSITFEKESPEYPFYIKI